MRNTFFKKLAVVFLSFVLCFTAFTGCKRKGEDDATVKFWVSGSTEQLAMYNALVEKFNEGYGKEHNVNVRLTTKPNGTYESAILYTANSDSGPDVILVQDAEFKKYAVMGFFCDIQKELDAVADIDISDIMTGITARLKYNIKTNTSNADDPFFALPLESQPSALYYNEDVLKAAGIIVISVDEEDMDKWNQGLIADKKGQKKSDFAKLKKINVPKKGFFRSENPYSYALGYEWSKVSSDEICVFNNRIAMNWDEVEDIASIFSVETNPDKNKKTVTPYGTTYGYFTENWFNYGWSVGGDCLRDLTGFGDWNFSLLDPSKNYAVVGESFTGRTGKVYKNGELLEFSDKADIKTVNGKDEVVIANDDGTYSHSGEAGGGKLGEWSGIATALNEGTIAELPSTRDAFSRYLRLGASKTSSIDGEGGLNISPNPNTFSNRSAINYFYGGNLAFVAAISPFMVEVAKYAKFKFDICPLVVYKEYTDPSDPYCDTVKVRGAKAGHSNTISLGVRQRSKNKQNAAAFIKWCASKEAQEIRAEMGFFPNQASLLNKIKFTSNAPLNAAVFSESMEFEKPGDWWYMPDYNWVQQWCVDLNSKVRNGAMDYSVWALESIPKTNTALKEYKKYQRT